LGPGSCGAALIGDSELEVMVGVMTAAGPREAVDTVFGAAVGFVTVLDAAVMFVPSEVVSL